MRTLNLRLLAILLVIAVVAAGGVHLIHGVQMRRHAGRFLDLARETREKKDVDESLRHFASYLRFAPNDADVLAEYGILLADLSRDREAFEPLEKALRRLPDRTDVRRKLIDITMRFGRYSDAQEHLRTLLKISADAELLELLARCQAAQGHDAEAEKTYRMVIDAAPERLTAYRARAELLRNRLNRPRDADDCMDAMIAAHADSPQANLLYADYRQAKGDVDAASRYVAKALEKSPDDLEALALAARTALVKGRYDEARRHASRGLAVDPKNLAMYRILAEVEGRSGKPEQATAWLKKGIEAAGSSWELMGDMTIVLVEQGKAEEAATWIEKLRAAGAPPPFVLYVQARIDCERRRWPAACRALEEARPGLATAPRLIREVDYWLGRCYGHLADSEKEIAAYSRMTVADPASARAHYALASALASSGKTAPAIEEFGKTMRLSGAPPQGWATLARLLFQKNLGLEPAARDWKAVFDCIERMGQAAPESPEVVVLRAELLAAQGRPADAQKLVEEAREKRPAQVELWLAEVDLLLRERAGDRAAALLKAAQERFGDTLAIRLARARLIVRQQGKEGIAALKDLARDAERLPEPERLALWRGLAIVLFQLGDPAAAQSFARRAIEKDPFDLDLPLFLFEMAARAGDAAGIENALEKIETIEGKGAFWHYGRAVLLTAKAGRPAVKGEPILAEADKHLAEARKLRPAWPKLLALAAQVALARGDPAAALDDFRQAIKLGNREPGVFRGAIEILYRQKKYDEAGELLRSVEQQGRTSPALDRLGVQLSLSKGEFDRALEQAERVATNTKDYRDHLWLAVTLDVQAQRASQAGRSEEAKQRLRAVEEALRQAIRQAPQAPEAWLALVQYLVRTGRKAEAEKALEESKAKVSGDGVPLFLAEACHTLGRIEEAGRLYEAAIAKSPDSATLVRRAVEFYVETGKADQAEARLRRILAEEGKAGQPKAAWARRQLALLLASHRKYADLRQALALIDPKTTASDGPGDRRLRAVLLSQVPPHEGRSEAIRGLEELLAKYPDAVAPDDRLLLAQLYAARGDEAKAQQQFRELAMVHGKEPRFLAAYVQSLLRQKETGEAELWVKRLTDMAPQDRLGRALQAEVEFRRQRYEETIALVKGTPPASAPATSAPAERRERLAAAEELEGFGQRLAAEDEKGASKFFQEAEALLREHVRSHPEDSLLLAALVARRGRPDESLQLLEAGRSAAAPQRIALVAGAILRGKTPPVEQLRRLDAVLETTLKDRGRPLPLLFALSELRTAESRFEEVEAVYREVLAKEPGDMVAANNLAELLALQGKKLDEALSLIERAIASGGPIATLLDTRATVYLAQGKPRAALADLESSVADDPTPLHYFHLAQVHHALGEKGPAVNALAQARDRGLKPEHLHCLEREVYRKLLADTGL